MRALLALSLLLLTPAVARAGVEVKKSEKGVTYSIRIPDGFDRARSALLVMAYHGRGTTHDEFMRTMASMEFLKKAIVVVPQAPNAEKMWDQNDIGPGADLVRELQERFHPPRTVAYGFSAGGYFTFTMGLSHPTLYQGAIPCAGGMAMMPPADEAVKKLAWYVVHGDADTIVRVEQSRRAVERLKEIGVGRIEYEELKGVGHTLDHPSTKRAFEWLEKTLGPLELPDAETKARLEVVEKALKVKDWDAAAKGFDALSGAPARAAGKVAALARAHTGSSHEPLAVAATLALGRLGVEAIPILKKIQPEKSEAAGEAAAKALAWTGAPEAAEALLTLLKSKPERVAVAAAGQLKVLGGDPAIGALIAGLGHAEGMKTPDARQEAIVESLKKLTGQSFENSKDWKKWAAGRK